MKKIKLVVYATLISMVSLSGCKTTQQPQISTENPEIITQKQETVTTVYEDETPSDQGIVFFVGSLIEGLEKAKVENKLLFVDCYTTWCSPCKILKKYAFKDANLGDYMKDNYVALAIDMETSEGVILAKKYGIEAYPTLLFLDKYGRVVNLQVGAIGAEALLVKAEQTVRKKM